MSAPERRYFGDAFRIVRRASGGADERLVLVFECYLDDSGTSGLPIVTMAGFVAPISNWEKMEPAFEEIMTRYEVPVFHAKKFHSSRKPFNGWPRIKKRTFTEEVFSVARGKMAGFSVSLRRQALIQAKASGPGYDQTSPYGMCFALLLIQIVGQIPL